MPVDVDALQLPVAALQRHPELGERPSDGAAVGRCPSPVRALGWIDSYWALVVPAIADAFSIFLLRQFFLELPQELVDAARIDACGWFAIYWRIALPLVKPALVTTGLLTFIRQWDAFFWPLIATSSAEYTVVQVGLAKYITEFVTFWDRLLAGSVAASLPVLVLYFVLQRYYVQGISTTGVKT